MSRTWNWLYNICRNDVVLKDQLNYDLDPLRALKELIL